MPCSWRRKSDVISIISELKLETSSQKIDVSADIIFGSLTLPGGFVILDLWHYLGTILFMELPKQTCLSRDIIIRYFVTSQFLTVHFHLFFLQNLQWESLWVQFYKSLDG